MDRRIQIISLWSALVIALFLTIWLGIQRGMLVETRAQESVERLSSQVLRFHVLANSDSKEDQTLKLEVKEAVMDYLEREMTDRDTLEETVSFVKENIPEIEQTARRVIQREGADYPVKAKLVRDSFPVKTYGDVTFPSGTYQALRIEIGASEGQNWWCCLYPGLCFADTVHAVVPEEGKQQLRGVLDEDTYDMIMDSEHIKIKWFFLKNLE